MREAPLPPLAESRLTTAMAQAPPAAAGLVGHDLQAVALDQLGGAAHQPAHREDHSPTAVRQTPGEPFPAATDETAGEPHLSSADRYPRDPAERLRYIGEGTSGPGRIREQLELDHGLIDGRAGGDVNQSDHSRVG